MQCAPINRKGEALRNMKPESGLNFNQPSTARPFALVFRLPRNRIFKLEPHTTRSIFASPSPFIRLSERRVGIFLPFLPFHSRDKVAFAFLDRVEFRSSPPEAKEKKNPLELSGAGRRRTREEKSFEEGKRDFIAFLSPPTCCVLAHEELAVEDSRGPSCAEFSLSLWQKKSWRSAHEILVWTFTSTQPRGPYRSTRFPPGDTGKGKIIGEKCATYAQSGQETNRSWNLLLSLGIAALNEAISSTVINQTG